MKLFVNRNLFVICLLDIVLLLSAICFSYLIRFDFDIPEGHWNRLVFILPFLLGIKLFTFYFFDLYKGMWRYTSLNDLVNILKASTISTLCLIVLILYVNRFENVSRSVFLIDWCLTVLFIISVRLFVRFCFSKFTGQIGFREIKDAFFQVLNMNRKSGNKVLIVGAGDCGEMVCREFRENASIKSYVIGFLDDDKRKIGRKIHGIPVLGMIEDIDRVVESVGVDDIVIAIPSAGPERMRQIVTLCEQTDISFKTVPDLGEVIDGRITISSIRNVEYKDLLGRKPIRLDRHKIGERIGNKIVMVTGAAGSIGSGLCRQICRYAPEKIILFERAESPLYDLDIELKKLFSQIEIIPLLGDVQDREELFKVFEKYKPHLVFHAAAYKHVPMLEKYPWKAIENNILATQNIVEAADYHQCETFVFVSTDKAVNPFNIMGTSKRISEMIVQSQSTVRHSKTSFITVRFGNVIGSVGSVIPLFKKQIQDGGPVTVTHPEIIRFFMLIPEACQLILQAGVMGNGGEIFILEMGEPVRIDTMARELIRFYGYEPDVDIKIEYTGLRPGEKLFEELMTDHENVVPTKHDKIMVLNSSQVDVDSLDKKLSMLKKMSKDREYEQIRKIFKEIVPEYNLNPKQ